jgi:hypothetical protein
MKKITIHQIVRTLNWRWIVTTFCFFVLFHLLLFYFLSNFNGELFRLGFWSRVVIVFLSLAFISMYVGYRAREFVSSSCGIAAILYIVTLKIFLPFYLAVPVYLLNMYVVVECCIVGFIFAFGGAGIGYWIKHKYQIQ